MCRRSWHGARLALAGEPNPSRFRTGEPLRGRDVTLRNPVEQVSWEDADRWLPRWNLALPTEAQWEFACRAGTDTPWHTGNEAVTLQGYANIADAWCKANGGGAISTCTEEVDDGHTVHAPVGSFEANRFGLHDMHGNVWEWCHEVYGAYPDEPVTDSLRSEGSRDRVSRGGGWMYRRTLPCSS